MSRPSKECPALEDAPRPAMAFGNIDTPWFCRLALSLATLKNSIAQKHLQQQFVSNQYTMGPRSPTKRLKS